MYWDEAQYLESTVWLVVVQCLVHTYVYILSLGPAGTMLGI